MITVSILTCPSCDQKESNMLQENVTPVSFRCNSCDLLNRISSGQCCIYCQYGNYPCLNAQIAGTACCSG